VVSAIRRSTRVLPAAAGNPRELSFAPRITTGVKPGISPAKRRLLGGRYRRGNLGGAQQADPWISAAVLGHNPVDATGVNPKTPDYPIVGRG
jgi:hypothetical protein